MKYFRLEPEETFTGLMEREYYSARALGWPWEEEIAAQDQPPSSVRRLY
jgi:hypothetical protein